MQMSTRRGAGYCLQSGCSEYLRSVLLRGVPGRFECPTCLHVGELEVERGVRSRGARVYREVRVQFNFDPERRIYRDVARVVDRRVPGERGAYTLLSPLVCSRAQAVRVGEAALRSLNRGIMAPRRRRAARSELVEQGWPVLV